MKRSRVYLSGGMQYAKQHGAQWRQHLGQWIRGELRHTVIDPSEASRSLLRLLRHRGWKLRGRLRTGGDWPAFFRLIVDRDIRLVRSCSYVICNWNMSARKGAGTQGELTVAREGRIPVYLVSRMPPHRLPGWIQGCMTKHFHSFKDLRGFLKQQYT